PWSNASGGRPRRLPMSAPASSTEAADGLEQSLLRRDWQVFILLTFLFMFGFAVYSGVFQNFLRDSLQARELDLGILESLREVPGLLAALTAGTLVALAESRVAVLGLAVTAVGIGITGTAQSLPVVIAISVFWSIGFHLYSSVSGAITLALAKGKEGGRHLGRMTGVGALATICGLGFSLLLAWVARSWLGARLDYNVYFVIAGISIGISSFLCSKLSHHAAGGARQRLVFRREYGLFYLLTFLEGCRRQIFSIFATFTLILVYKVPVERMLLLQFVNAILIAFTAPQMGRLVDRIGERTPLTIYAIGLIVVFLGYATSGSLAVLYALYLLDNVLFSFGVGITTYLHRIVRPGEFTPCLAMGVTMNHIAAVSVPVGGALLWKASGNYQVPFMLGAVIAVAALLATFRLPEGPRPQPSS
ncbi:MAG TPA: MFS transporter, partial [Fimbriimonadaceae bacterium]|nr:MFS transporter [Fimbriimonadaceae bacterium]